MRKLYHKLILAALLLIIPAGATLAWHSAAFQNLQLSRAAPSTVSCRDNPLAHVYEPKRLIVLSECATVSGVVYRAKYNPGDGDFNIWVDLDAEYLHLLVPSNDGKLVAKIIPTDHASVYIPHVGEHATFYGALVQNKMRQNAVEIHPAWLITTPKVTGALVPQSTLNVRLVSPDKVLVGDRLSIQVTVRSTMNNIAQPVTGARLFVEIVSSKGQAVRWKATATNQLGLATLNLVALEGPGNYTIWVYATDGHKSGITQAPLMVKRS